MGKNFNNNNNRMYAVKVEKAGFSGIYKGAGTRDEVRQDIEFLRARGVKHEEMTVLPIIGKPRKEIEKVVINTNTEDRQLIVSASKASASYAKGVLVGTVLGAGVLAGAYLLYKSSKKEEEKEKEE